MNRHNFPTDWPAPESYLLELGRMTAMWGSLESSTLLAINKLAGYESIIDVRAVILVAHSNFQQRIDIVETLCEQISREHPELASYKSVVSKVRAAQKSRNKYAHNALSVNDETGEVGISYASARGTLKLNYEIVQLADIKDVTAKIHEAMCLLHTLVTGRPLIPIWDRRT